MAFGRDVAGGHFAQQLRSSSLGLARIIAFQLRAVGEGIVVAGKRIGTIEVLDNVVEDTVQGIHVGISDPTPQSGRESAERILITRNVVHCLVPRTYDGDRLAVFVGNAKSIHVKDTIATVRWAGEKLSERPYALIEGIRVHGQLGPFMVVRQSSLDGFDVGVRIVPLQPLPRKHMWLVAETLVANGASGASFALDAPPEVDREHNVPSAGWRSTWHQIVPISFGGLEGLAFYDRTNGFGEFYTVDSAGNMNLLRQQPGWRKTWDLIVSTQIAGVSGLLFYDRAAGESSLYTVNDHGEMKFLRLVPDQKSWDIIIPIEIGGVDALLFYDRTMGYGEMRNVGSQGELTVAMEHVAWPKSWHQIVPVRVAGTSGLAFYDRGDGRAIVYRIEQDALITQLTNPVENWSKTVDLVVPVRLGGKTGVLLYDSTNGRGEFRTIDAQGKTTVVNTGTQWRKDWKIIVPRTFGGVSGLVFYAPSGARGAFYTLDPKGTLTEIMTSW
jgi:hypothetical protein